MYNHLYQLQKRCHRPMHWSPEILSQPHRGLPKAEKWRLKVKAGKWRLKVKAEKWRLKVKAEKWRLKVKAEKRR